MHECRLCRSTDLELVIDLGSQPIAHRLPGTKNADEERFPFAVHVCKSCGLTQILEPIDPEVLYRGFNYNFSSWKPEPHMPDELDTIITLGTPNSACEIGCNDGLFMDELRKRGVKTVIGVEPNPAVAAVARERGFEVFNDMVDTSLMDQAIAKNGGKFDLVVSRQVLEHIPDHDKFFASIDAALKPDGLLFIDVPDFDPAGSVGDVSTLWEEHVSYFTEATLTRLFARHGFKPVSVKRYNFSGGGLAIAAKRESVAIQETDPSTAVALSKRFGEQARAYGARLNPALASLQDAGIEVAIYGAGCRACAFCNAHELGDVIANSIDDQVERQGKYLPGSKIPIKSAEDVANGDGPLVVLLAVNNENEDKVVDKFTGMTSRPVTFIRPFAPSDIWSELDKLEAHAREVAA